MASSTEFEKIGSCVLEYMALSIGPPAHQGQNEEVFNRLALELFALQFSSCEPYRALCNSRGVHPRKVRHWAGIPAIPTSTFKEYDLSCLPPDSRTTVFHSSGTSGHRPSRHFHSPNSLGVYEASLLPWFQAHFLPSTDSFAAPDFDLVILTPPPAQAPHSSLVYMFQIIRRLFGSVPGFYGHLTGGGGWTMNYGAVVKELTSAIEQAKPVALLGTAFSFVHLLDFFAEEEIVLNLPAGSRAMETGGYKGRSRALPKPELHSLIKARLGVPASHILSEYGMSELGSQAYDCVVGEAIDRPADRLFRFPPWVRAQVVSPETSKQVKEHEIGLVRVFDLANVYSVMALQTQDLARSHVQGFELLGRGTEAEPRGCSLMPVTE